MNDTAPTLDWQECLRLCGNKEEVARELLTMFATELPNMREAIRLAFDKKDFEQFQEEIHKLHGACCYVGVPQLRALSEAIEVQLKTHDEPAINIDALQSEIQRVLTAIEREQQ